MVSGVASHFYTYFIIILYFLDKIQTNEHKLFLINEMVVKWKNNAYLCLYLLIYVFYQLVFVTDKPKILWVKIIKLHHFSFVIG